MNDLVIDKRIFLQQSKRKNNGRSVLPQIKYPINFNMNGSNIMKKINQDLTPKQLPYRIKQSQPYQPPLANILISKRIAPSNPEDSPNAFRRKQNFTIIRKESSIKLISEHQNTTQQHKRKTSTSLSQRVNRKKQEKQAIKLINEQAASRIKVNKNQQFMVLIGKGNNNQDLVRQILLARKIWKEIKSNEGTPHLKWVFSKQRHNYKKMWSYTKTRSINHFQFNEEISTKDNLIRNLQIYCETKKIEIFSLTPVTFIIDFDEQYCEYNLKQFLSFFLKNDPRKMGNSTRKNGFLTYNFINKFQPYMAWQNSQIKKRVNILSRPVNASTYYSNDQNPSYIWLLKPTGLNRGRGIQIFDSLESLQKILADYLQMMNRRKFKQNSATTNKQKQKSKITKQSPPQQDKNQQQNQQTQQVKFCTQKFRLSTCSFVIQKYVERPFLIQKRKFDIRVWVLVDHHLNIYFCKEGYIRTSTQTFSTQNIDNYFIHLTNNAIQKNSATYGLFENGNQLSYKGLAQFIGQQQCMNIWQRMKQITHMAFSSVKKKLNQNNRKFCFQLFGLDFIIDDELKVWLIQVNDSPCLQCSSPLLSALIPRMINDAFRLTIDQIFTQKRPFQQVYQLPGYPNTENLWEHLGQLTPNAEYSPKKPTNHSK